MSLKEIAVEGCKLEFQNGGSPNTAITINPKQTSSKVKAEGKAVYKTLKFSISGYSAPSSLKPNWVPDSGSGNGEISATSVHATVEGNKVLLKDDVSLQITISGQEYQGDHTVPATFMEIVKITNAGQTSVKGS